MAKIIVIDDEPYILLLLKKMLEKEGYQVDMATNGVEGIELYHKHGADLIITDIVMPEKEGLETIINLKAENPSLKVIAISGGGRVDSREYLHSAQLLGAEKIFQKPFKKDEIVQAVRELLVE
jgi:CheY-like chemotaxis protein